MIHTTFAETVMFIIENGNTKSLREMADSSGISTTVLSRWCNGLLLPKKVNQDVNKLMKYSSDNNILAANAIRIALFMDNADLLEKEFLGL